MQETVSGELLGRLARFGRLHILDECVSTNDYALSLVEGQETAIVVCRRQTAGRGRFGRRWFSDEDSLTFSMLILPRPDEAVTLPFLTQIAGLAVCVAIEELTELEPLIRWPNDVLIGPAATGRREHQAGKVAGILCEQRKNAIAVGVGVNVNQVSFSADVPEPVSLCQATGRTWNRYELLERVLERFFAYKAEAAQGRGQALLDAIKKRSSILHRRVEVQTMFRRFVGTVIDLDAEGRVVLRTSSGRLAVIGSGQARRLR